MSRFLKRKNKFLAVWVDVDLDALAQNLRAIRRHISKTSQAEVLAVVKADAYGHGMVPVSKRLWKEGVRFFGVANIDEALLLRRALPESKILVLGTFHFSQASLFIKNKIIPTIFSLQDALCFHKAVAKKERYPIHVKIDTGMGRLGVWHEGAKSFLKEIQIFKNLDVQGIYTHLSCADSENTDFTNRQLERFKIILDEARRMGIRPKWVHAANSLGLSRFAEAQFNLVRPGIILYGINPMVGKKLPFKIEPIFSLRTRLSYVKDVEKGRTVSYGAAFVAKKPTKIATLPIGYSHGYRVAFSNKAQAFVNGRICPVIGRVTMDQTLLDVTRTKARQWDIVELIGKKTPASAEKLALLGSTIPYEILCGIHPRVPRFYTP